MKDIIVDSYKRIQLNWREYLYSAIVFQLLRGLILLPSFAFLFSKILERAKIFGITNKTLILLLKNPFSLFLTLLLLIFVSFSIFYELGYYFLLVEFQKSKREYTIYEIIKKLNSKWKKFFGFSSLFIVIYFILLLPLASFGLQTELTESFKIPNFIVDELLKTTGGAVLYFSVIALTVYLSLRLIYTIYFFVNSEGLSLFQAAKKSYEATEKNTFRNFILFLLSMSIFIILALISVLICLIPIILVERYIPSLVMVVSIVTLTLVQFLLYFAGSFSMPLLINSVVGSIEGTKSEKDIVMTRQEGNVFHKPKSAKNKYIRRGIAIFVGIMFVVNGFALYTIIYNEDIGVIAHRGYTANAVENTITALRDAATANADMMELDIQETADGEFIVMHDYNLKRFTGASNYVKDMTLEELKKVKINQNGHTDEMSSLSEFIDVAKELNIGLLIEVKPHGGESPEMEENLVKLLREKNVLDYFIIQSLELDVLDRIKEIEPDAITCYVIPFLVGNLMETEHDFVALEDYSLREKTIEQARAQDMGVLAWTINDEALIKKYLLEDIDGIITDKVELAIKWRDNSSDRSFVERILDFF